jgi:magnesium-transporting ATPase (P-type)
VEAAPRYNNAMKIPFYYAYILVLVSTVLTIFLCAHYAKDVKHSYDEDYHPKHEVVEGMTYFAAVLFGSLGLLASYLLFAPIRKEDSLNSRRFLWISLAMFAVQVTALVLLSYFGIVTYDLSGFSH